MSVIFVGNEFKYKKTLQNIILANVNYSSLYFFENINFDIIEEIIYKNKQALIITNKDNYATASKLLATINDDTLVLKGDQLIPEKTSIYEENSFITTLKLEEKTLIEINLIKIDNNKIPNILLSQQNNNIVHIFNYDIDTAKLFLAPTLNSFNANYTFLTNEGGWVECHIDNITDNIKNQINQILPQNIISNNIFSYIVEKLKENKQTITFAESCTGGLLATNLTKTSGSSDVFYGSSVTYSNDIKNKWLGVDNDVLLKYGAVSEATVKEMLLGALNISNSNIAISVSGIAGPTGGSKEKPVGTVFIGISDGKNTMVEKHLFNGNREYIQYQAMMNSIRILINFPNFL